MELAKGLAEQVRRQTASATVASHFEIDDADRAHAPGSDHGFQVPNVDTRQWRAAFTLGQGPAHAIIWLEEHCFPPGMRGWVDHRFETRGTANLHLLPIDHWPKARQVTVQHEGAPLGSVAGADE